jgi:peptide/nickel transport system permease protein
MRSPITIMAAIVTLLLFFAALAAPWLAPHDTYDVASLNLVDAFRPPARADGGDPSFLLGSDDQGRDMLSAIIQALRLVSPCTQRIDRLIDLLEQIRGGP